MDNVKVESRDKPFCKWCRKEIKGEAVKVDRDTGKVDYCFISEEDTEAPRTDYYCRDCYKKSLVSKGSEVEN